MSCYTENILFEMPTRVHENPVKDIDELKERTLAVGDAPAAIPMAPEEAENIDVEPEAVPEPDPTHHKFHSRDADATTDLPMFF
ncbi:unnamed protein product [Caenorhabditis nigoni]